MEMANENWKYVLNIISRSIPRLFFWFKIGPRSKVNMNWISLLLFLLINAILRMLPSSEILTLFGVLSGCSIPSFFSSNGSESTVTASCIHSSLKTSFIPAHLCVIFVESRSSRIYPLWIFDGVITSRMLNIKICLFMIVCLLCHY